MQDGELRDRLTRVETQVEIMGTRQDKMDGRFDALDAKLEEIKALISDKSGFIKGALWVAGGVGAFLAVAWKWIESHWSW
jgi:hypothetical protein